MNTIEKKDNPFFEWMLIIGLFLVILSLFQFILRHEENLFNDGIERPARDALCFPGKFVGYDKDGQTKCEVKL